MIKIIWSVSGTEVTKLWYSKIGIFTSALLSYFSFIKNIIVHVTITIKITIVNIIKNLLFIFLFLPLILYSQK